MFTLIFRGRRLSARSPGPASSVEAYHPRGSNYNMQNGCMNMFVLDFWRDKRIFILSFHHQVVLIKTDNLCLNYSSHVILTFEAETNSMDRGYIFKSP